MTTHLHPPGQPGGMKTRLASGAAHMGLLAGLLAVALLLAEIVRGEPPGRQVVPLALPEAAGLKPLWRDERGALAAKLTRGYGLSPGLAEEFAGWILEAAVRQRLAPDLLAGLVMAESTFRKTARSPFGAVGPAQVRADLWRGFCGEGIEEPDRNIYCGAQILAHHRETCARLGDAEPEACALRAYNVGFRNRDNAYFVKAAARYVAKIQRFRAPLAQLVEA